VLLVPIYAASEEPIDGVSSAVLGDRVAAHGGATVRLVARLEDVPAAVDEEARDGDLVLTLGAGSIGSMGPRILARLRKEPV
jgi:UDP-N-acetylmuramate--alanine ligase